MNLNRCVGLLGVAVLLAMPFECDAGRFPDYVLSAKYANSVDEYLSGVQRQAAKAYWEVYKIVDTRDLATIPLSTQVGFAAGTQKAEVTVPPNYSTNHPVGIFVFVPPGETAYLPATYETVCNGLYLIGASPDYAGNDRHDMERIARVLDLIASLKAQYNVDPDRIYVSGFSGGALIAQVCNFLYPEVFKGCVPGEHGMAWPYMCGFLTEDDIQAEVQRNYRYCFIRGLNSYASSYVQTRYTEWLGRGLDARLISRAGMGHEAPWPADLQEALNWVDAPVSRDRATNWVTWSQYAFLGHSDTNLQTRAADADLDGLSNWEEYVRGLPPLRSDAGKPLNALAIDSTSPYVRYRAAAPEIGLMVGVSDDLLNWDTTGTNVLILETIPYRNAISTVRFRAGTESPQQFFNCSFQELAP